MANQYTTRLTTTAPRVGGLIAMPGVRSTNPMVQAQITAAQKKREEEEREAARQAAILQKKTTNTGVENAMAGLGAAPEVTPAAARLKSTNPVVAAALERKYAAEDAAYAAWDAQRKARQAARAEEVKQAGGIYATLPQNADFTVLSAARGDVSDPTYRYVNNADNYRESAEGKWNLTNDRKKLQYMTEDEVKTYNYLYNKHAAGDGRWLALDYLGELSNELDRRQAEAEEKKSREFAQEHPIAASAVSVPDSVIGGVSAAVDLGLQGAKKLVTGEDINYNSRYQQFGRRAEDVRGAVSEEIESPVGRFLYDVGMSAADSLAAGYTGLGGTALGLSAGASTAQDAASRGASDGQALLAGAAVGIAEGLFEKFSIGNLKAMKDVPVTGVKSVVTNLLKSMGVNASEEAATELANILTDRVIMGDMSHYRTSVEAYKAAGESEGGARWKAALDALGQVGMAALSGAVMGGAFGGIGSVQSGIENFAAGGAVRRAGIEQDVLDTGGAQVRGTDARTLADRLSEKQAAGGTLGRAEIGALARETARQEARNRDALGNDLPMFDDAEAAVRASAAALRRAGAVMGREVRFFRDAADVGGYAEDGVVWLNVDSRDPMAQVFAHELTHTAENADVYAELRQMALGAMDAGELSAAIEKKKKTYRNFAAKSGSLVRELDDASAEAELVADYAASLFTDEAEIGEFARRNRGAAARIYERLREWVAGMRGDEEKAALARAQRVYAKALRQTSEDARGERQYLFAGERSKQADLHALEQAKNMQKSGMDAETILRETGWFVGSDGKWRYEIDDSGMQYSRDGDMSLRNETEYRRMVDLSEKKHLTASEQVELAALEGEYADRVWEEKYSLQDYLQHDALFAAYPELRHATLIFTSMEEGHNGYYDERDNSIVLNRSLQNAPEGTLVHEIQHIIQKIEGFARGSSVEYWDNVQTYGNPIHENDGKIKAAKRNYRQIFDNAPDWFKNKVRALNRATSDQDYDTVMAIEDELYNSEYADLYSELAMADFLQRGGRGRELTPGELYRNTAGEIEARDARDRMEMTARERRASMPYTGDEYFTVFVEDDHSKSYDLGGYSDHQIENWANSGRIQIYKDDQQYNEFIRKSLSDNRYDQKLYFGTITEELAERIYQDTGIEVEGYNLAISSHEVRKILNNSHGENAREESRGQRAITVEDLAMIPIIVISPDSVTLSEKQYNGRPVIVFEKTINGRTTVVTYSSQKRHDLTVQTMYAGKEKGSLSTRQSEVFPFSQTSKTVGGTASSNIIPDNRGNVKVGRNRKYSIAEDTETEAEQENAAEAPLESEQERQQRAETNYQYMIDRMMERAANRDAFGDAYSGVSGNIGDLLRREAENVKTPKAAEPGRAFALDGSMAKRGITREMLNVRAAETMGKIEKHAREDIGFALGLSYWADHTESNAAIERLVTQYLWNGQYAVSEADAQRRTNEAFDALFADAEEKNRAFYDKYKNLSDVIAQYIGYDRADAKKKYREITKRGTLEGFSLSDESIAEAYGALREKAPELFPEREGAGEQLKRMLQIASGIEQIKYRMDKMATEAGHLHWVMRAKVDFVNAINDTLREAELVRRYAEDKRSRAAEEAEVPTDPMDLVEVSAKVRDLKREADRLANRYLFTEDDKAVIDRLMRGELKRSEVVSPNKAGILAVYDKLAEAEAANQVIKKYNARRRAQLDDLADTAMGDLEKTKDKAAGLQYSTNTMERNVADVFRDKEAAKAVRQNFFDVVHRATADMTRAQNAFNERVAALNISQKAAKGNRDSEAYVVQLMGEAQDSIAQYKKKEQDGFAPEQINGKTKADWEGVIADIRAANPNMDWAKIDGAIEEFRAIYNELFEQMNLVRVTNGYPPIDYRRGYFPHFQKNEPDTVFGRLLAGLGVKAEVTPLPTSINGMTDKFKPGISWFSHAQARTGFATDYDAIEGYQQYVRGALRVIYQTENIQRLRALERRIRYATTDDGMKERIKAKQAELDANDALSEDEKIEIMQNLYAQGRFTLSNFCNELSEYTNILAGKRSRLDRGMEALIGRNAYNVLKTLNNRLGANMVAANIGSAMTNFIPLQQGYAQLGARRLMSGMWDTVRAIAREDGFAVRSDFLTNRRGSTTVSNTAMDRVSAAAGRMMETVDKLTSESLVRARYAQNIKAGLSQEAALEEADRWAAKVMGDRSMGAMPTIFHATNPVVKVFTQFQLEVANNVGYIFKDLPKDAAEKGKGELAKLLIKYALSAWLFNELYEYIFGRRPALDPISWINEASGDLTGYELPNLYELGVEAVSGELDAEDFQTKREGIYPAVANLFKNVAEQVPYVGGILPMFVDDVDGRLPISSAVPNLVNLGKVLDKDRSAKDKAELAYKELIKPVAYLAMPFGGGQLKKAFEGIWAAAHGGSYTYNTQGEKILQYPIVADTVAGTVWNYAQAGLFGKSSFKTAQDWVDSGFDSFSAKETAIYRGLLDVGVSGKEAYAAVRQLGDIQKTDEQTAAELKRQTLRDMTLSEDAKAVIYYGMLATEKEQALLDAFEDENFRTARAAMLLCDMRDAKTTAEERKLLADARGLGDVEKVMIYREKISTAWDDEIAAMHEAGFAFDDFLEAQNMLAEIEAKVNADSSEKEEKKESDPLADARKLLTVGGVPRVNEEEEKKKAKVERDEAAEKKLQRDNAFIDWAIKRGYKMNERFVMMDCFGVSTEAKKDNQNNKIGIVLPTLPEIKMPEIKLPSLPQISLPGSGR